MSAYTPLYPNPQASQASRALKLNCFLHDIANRFVSSGNDHGVYDSNLPLSLSTLNEHFGCEPLRYNEMFAAMQCFCAIKLEKHQQVSKSALERLPLLKQQWLGSGAFGVVYRVIVKGGYLETSDCELAMKVVKPWPKSNEEWETSSWIFKQHLSHDNILKAVASVKTPLNIYIFFPLAECSLEEYMTKRYPSGLKTFEERREIFRLIIGVARALEYMHYQCRILQTTEQLLFVHRDLRRDNILVMQDDKTSAQESALIFKIADFGISTMHLGGDTQERSNTFVGSVGVPRRAPALPHIAPEAQLGGEVGGSVDVWAFGIVLVELIAWMHDRAEALQTLDAICSETGNPWAFKITQGAATLKKQFRKWLDTATSLLEDLLEDKAEAKMISSSLELLKERILVYDPNQQANIAEVRLKLEQIFQGL